MNFNQDSTPIRFTPKKDPGGVRSSENVSSRPSGEPDGKKDFKKILAKSEEEDQGQNAKSQGVEDAAAQSAAVLGPAGKKKPAQSLFDLTSSKSVAKKSNRFSQNEEEMTKPGVSTQADSPNTVFARLTTDDKAESTEAFSSEEYIGVDAENTKLPEKEKFTTRFATEQSDLSYVNPMAAMSSHPIESTTPIKAEKVEPTVNLQAVIDQLVEKVVEIKVNDRTETTITLKHPGIFKDANIVVTSFDSAKGEFNISFENLTQQAKNILDMQINKESLLDALEKKGYAVHILTTTTVNESRPILAEAQPGRESNRDRREPDQERQQQQRRRNQEEG